MDILKHSLIDTSLNSLNYFDLKQNNERLGVISSMNKSDSENQLQQIFSDILANKKINYGYYQLRNIFINSQLYDPTIILNLIIKTIHDKVNIIADVLFDSKSGFDIAKYTQMWSEYTFFNRQMYQLLNNHQKFLTEKNIKTSNMSNNILSIVHLCIFYDKIFGSDSKGKNILDNMIDFFKEDSDEEKTPPNAPFSDQKTIDQFINFIDSMRVFLIVQNFTKIDKVKIMLLIRKIMSNVQRINRLCSHMHKLLLKLENKIPISTECQTISLNSIEKPLISKIYKIASILAIYAEKEKLLICYSKFMQMRIINSKYSNLEIEIEIVKRISGAIGRYESQKLLNMITDIIQSRAIAEKLHKSTVNNVFGIYNHITPISPKIINPIVLAEQNWKIQNIQHSDLNICYPTEIQYCLDIVSKLFSKINTTNDMSKSDYNYIINWQPFLGTAVFEAEFKFKRVSITCNFMQAILLSYINEHNIISIDDFVAETHINRILGEKIFESLSDAGILVYADSSQKSYVVNSNNYVGESRIDLHLFFIEVFNPDKSEPISKNKFAYVNNIPSIELENNNNNNVFDPCEFLLTESNNESEPESETSSDMDDIPVIKSAVRAFPQPGKKMNLDESKSESMSESMSESESD